MEILISYAPYRHQRYSSTNSLKRTAVCMVKERVCFPYEFTLLSNLREDDEENNKFVSPTNLHCSQTPSDEFLHVLEFVSPTNLHCSQTIVLVLSLFIGLFPLRIYTALKQSLLIGLNGDSLFPLRIYTALKLISCKYIRKTVCFPYEFTLLSNNVSTAFYLCLVCFPYEFTLLSNCSPSFLFILSICFPYEFTLLSNLLDGSMYCCPVCFPYEFTLLSNLKSSKNNILQNTRVPS